MASARGQVVSSAFLGKTGPWKIISIRPNPKQERLRFALAKPSVLSGSHAPSHAVAQLVALERAFVPGSGRYKLIGATRKCAPKYVQSVQSGKDGGMSFEDVFGEKA